MASPAEYWIFADESVQKGALFSKFFGGCILPATEHRDVEDRLQAKKAELKLGKELKWQRVTDQRLAEYQLMMTAFFDEIRAGHVRMRVMFHDNQDNRPRPPNEDRHLAYYKLYYQFIKHAFGLGHMPNRDEGTRIRLFLDQFPHTVSHTATFKAYIAALPASAQLRERDIRIDPSHITEVDSSQHALMQCVDIVLGSMAFRFNDMHLIKPPGERRRGRRTIAKDKLYRHIIQEICTVKPSFNPKISTATQPYPEGRWSMPYRHWLFRPNDT